MDENCLMEYVLIKAIIFYLLDSELGVAIIIDWNMDFIRNSVFSEQNTEDFLKGLILGFFIF